MELVVPVGFVGPDHRLTGDLVTLSPYGLFVRAKRDVKVGTPLRVGIAVEFVQMSSHNRALLRRLYTRFSPPQG